MGLGGLRISTAGIGSGCVDSEPMGKAIVKNAGGHFEAHPTRALACSLVIAALGFSSANGCTGDHGKQPVNYTFDHGTEGWVLNKGVRSGYTNLGAGVPDGGSPPMVSFAASDGNPSPGSLRLTVAFTARFQYAAAGVLLGQARDLADKTLHARVRLVSGSAVGVWAGFYACGPDCSDLAMQIGATELAEGAWAPFASWVQAWTPPIIGGLPRFGDYTSVVELGIEVWTDGGAADGGAFENTGDLVFEIDTVTD